MKAQLLSQGLLIYSFNARIEGGMLRLTAATMHSCYLADASSDARTVGHFVQTSSSLKRHRMHYNALLYKRSQLCKEGVLEQSKKKKKS